MTRTSNLNRADCTGTGAITPIPINFPFAAATDLVVYQLDTSNVQTTLTLNVDYTVAGAGTTSGTVTPVAAIPSGYHWTVLREVDQTQETDIRNQGAYYPEIIEDALDKLTDITQQLSERMDRAVTAAPTSTTTLQLPSGQVGYALGWPVSADALGAVPSNVALALSDFASSSSAAKGAGMVGFTYALAYAAGTVGKAIKDVMDRATAVEGRATALEATDALDLLKHQIQTITATVASSALTVGLAPATLDFRSATLGSGVVNTRTLTTAASVVVPNGATLGTVGTVPSRIVVLALDNAGTIELAVVNLAGGSNLDETTLISTTAINTSSDAANVVYSTTARTNLPFRVVGYVESTQATAGTWATAPSTIQGAGGQALSALSGLGYGQTWQDVTASRVVGTTYYNTTGRPIVVAVRATENSGSAAANNVLQIDGVVVSKLGVSDHSAVGVLSAIVPPGSSYLVPTMTSETINAWMELR